ncbi:TlpA disulfide reductase family protein [Weeksellaceae bacterium A-14]
MKNIVLSFFLLFCSFFKSQNNFIIKGRVDDTKINEVILNNPFISPEYYEQPEFKSSVNNQNFLIKGSLSYPQAFRLRVGNGLSGLVFIDQGTHFINILSDSLSFYYPAILEESKINLELKNKFLPPYKKLIDQDLAIIQEGNKCISDSLNIECKNRDFIKLRKEIHIKQDSVIYKYAVENPQSYIPLWFIADKLRTFGYSDYQYEAFNSLSKKIQETKTGIELKKDLTIAKHFAVGQRYPTFNLKNGEVFNSLGKKYTLIDFWFSNCAPCIQQIPIYKRIYEKYKIKGLEIISISTDDTKYLANWKRIITEKKMDWRNLLDENGKESKKYSITKFPTTFLLDSEGVILQKDISPEELETFLNNNL